MNTCIVLLKVFSVTFIWYVIGECQLNISSTLVLTHLILVHYILYTSIKQEKALSTIYLHDPFTTLKMLINCIFLQMLDALSRLLEARYVSEAFADIFSTEYPELHAKYWSQLQMLLKKMLAVNLSVYSNKSSSTDNVSATTSNRPGDAGKLRELYKLSLKSTDIRQLPAMYNLWSSLSLIKNKNMNPVDVSS